MTTGKHPRCGVPPLNWGMIRCPWHSACPITGIFLMTPEKISGVQLPRHADGQGIFLLRYGGKFTILMTYLELLCRH